MTIYSNKHKYSIYPDSNTSFINAADALIGVLELYKGELSVY